MKKAYEKKRSKNPRGTDWSKEPKGFFDWFVNFDRHPNWSDWMDLAGAIFKRSRQQKKLDRNVKDVLRMCNNKPEAPKGNICKYYK